MILRRNGGKSKLAHKIIPHFPKHSIYIEPFFGGGGMFFNKPKARHNFLNDVDDDVFNLFMVVKDDRHKLVDTIQKMPIHQSLMKHWSQNTETDPVWKAVRFLFISNFTYLSKGFTMKLEADHTKKVLISRIDPTFEYLSEARFMNLDFRDIFNAIVFKNTITRKTDSFVYSDPPYLGTDGNYASGCFTEQDVIDHFDILQDAGMKFCVSEFDSPFIIDQANNRGLNIHIIGERKNIKNRRTEIIVTNYDQKIDLFS